MADPTKKRLITPQEIKEIQNYASLGATMDDIAAIVGISKRTLQRRSKDQEEVAVTLKKGRALANVKMSQSLFMAGTKKGNVTAMIFWLKARAGWTEHGLDPYREDEYTPKESLTDDPKKPGSD